MYTLDTSWTYIIIAVGITLYSFYTGIKEKQRKVIMEDSEGEELEEEEVLESLTSEIDNKIKEERVNNNVVYQRIEQKIDSVVELPDESKSNINTFKDRVKSNPKDLILFSEILKPKYLDF